MLRGLFVLWLVGSAIWVGLVRWTISDGAMPNSTGAVFDPPLYAGLGLLAMFVVMRGFTAHR